MPVTISHAPAKPASNRQKGYDLKVRAFAPHLLELQRQELISAGQITDFLRRAGVLTAKGKPYAESVIFGMLKRGKELGLGLIIRTRVEAAKGRPIGPRAPRRT